MKLRLGLGALAVGVAVTGVAGCGDDPNRIKPKNEVDLDALRTELIERYHAQTAIDMDEWYDLIVKRCEDNLSGWEMYIAQGVDGHQSADIERTGMSYICPGRAHIVDDAIKRVQESNRDANLACSLPKAMRTSTQQELAQALGC